MNLPRIHTKLPLTMPNEYRYVVAREREERGRLEREMLEREQLGLGTAKDATRPPNASLYIYVILLTLGHPPLNLNGLNCP